MTPTPQLNAPVVISPMGRGRGRGPKWEEWNRQQMLARGEGPGSGILVSGRGRGRGKVVSSAANKIASLAKDSFPVEAARASSDAILLCLID